MLPRCIASGGGFVTEPVMHCCRVRACGVLPLGELTLAEAAYGGLLTDVHFDMSGYQQNEGTMYLDLNEAFNVVVPEPTSAGALMGLALLVMTRRRRPGTVVG